MKRSFLISLAALILAVLGIFMLYTGARHNILPPTITGIGFLVIAVVFWKIK